MLVSRRRNRITTTAIVLGMLAALLPLLAATAAPARGAAPGDVVINEVLQNPNAVFDSNGEWFEVFNPTASAVDMDGWVISDNDFDSHTINNGGPLTVAAGGYLVLGRNADSAANGGVAVDYEYTGIALANGADELILTDGGVEIDRVEWDGGPDFPDPTGASMSLISPALDNNVGANWCTASTPFGDGDFGTPGAGNDCAPPATADVVINEVLQNPNAVFDSNGEWFEVFNPTASAVDMDGWVISDNDFDSHTINNGGPLTVAAGGYLVLGRNADSAANGGVAVDYEYTGIALANGADELILTDGGVEIDRVEWDGGPDFPDPTGASMSLISPALDNNVGANWCTASTPFGDGDFGTPGAGNDCAPPATADVVINEVLQNPNAVFDSNGEWFEVFNPTASAVDMDGWVISDNDFDSHTINNGGPLTVAAGGYLVLGRNADSAANGGVAVDYEYTGIALANGADELILTDGGVEIDRVEWDGGPDFPDPTGASMSLISPALDNNVGANWCTASTPFGDGDFGTPGAANDCVLFIHEVQGSGPTVAIPGIVQVDAIVTSLLEDNDTLDGFLLQEEEEDYDADPLTSEGIRVECGSACPAALAVGDNVNVVGDAGETFGMSEIDAVGGSIVVNTNGNPLPTATPLGLPAGAGTDEELTFEPVEGMLVEFTDELFVSEYFELARFGQVVLTVDERPFQFTHTDAPSTVGYSAFLDDLATRRIVLDDDNNNQNAATSGPAGDTPYYYPWPGFSTTNLFRGGDSIVGLTGGMDWAFGEWRVKPSPEVFDYTFTPKNMRTTAPDPVGGTLQVASFNVLNYFTTLDTGASICGPSGTLGCRGANSDAELTRQRDKIVSAMTAIDADIVGLVEVENNAGASVADLVGALNAAVGPGTYDYIDTGTIGTDAIKVGLIYKPATVRTIGDFAILDSSVDPRFLDTKNRPVLIQTFEENATAARFTVAVNHLKSKGSPCVDVGDPNLLDGQGNCNQTRTDAVSALVDYLATDPTGSGDPDFLIAGDLNAYAMEDPITAAGAAGYTDLIETFGGSDSYSFVFDGQLGYLDHALANGSLTSQVTGVTEWHINADEVNAIDYNDGIQDPGEASFERKSNALPIYEPDAYRSSDHDPLVVGLALDTARDLKEKAVADLEALLPTGSSENDHRVEQAIGRIEDSLSPDRWESDTVLDAEQGNHVFDREQQAVQELMKVDPPDDAAAQDAIDKLIEADRQLAQVAIDAAVAGGGDPGRIASALDEMALAAVAVADGDYDKAVGHYKKAWQESIKAL